MYIKTYHVILVMAVLFFSCNKEEEQKQEASNPKDISGKIQKGPYLSGSTVNIFELDENLIQTGRSFTTQSNSDAGDFNLNGIQLESDLVLMTSDGFYFNELKALNSQSRLLLQAYTNVSENDITNVNVLTHVIKGRIENLLASGMGYEEAYAQAKAEMYSFLGIEDFNQINFEQMDISEDENHDSVLLAFSAMVQRYPGYTTSLDNDAAELSQLLSELESDFADDGDINEQANINSLLDNISFLVPTSVVSNLNQRYEDIGLNASAAQFQFVLDRFMQKHDSLYTDYDYPELADCIADLDYNLMTNLLHKETTEIDAGLTVIVGIAPIGKILKVKIIQVETNIQFINPFSGWHSSDSLEGNYNVLTLESLRHNNPVTGLIAFSYTSDATETLIVEYYEDGSETPTFTKTVTVTF